MWFLLFSNYTESILEKKKISIAFHVKGLWQDSKKSAMVVYEKTWFSWMDYNNCPSHLWKCPIKSLCWFQIQQWIRRKSWVHQGSVLSPLLFAIVMEAKEYRVGCSWEFLYADNLVIAVHSLESLKIHFQYWKSNLESKGLKINNKKTKLLTSNHNAPTQIDNSKYPCGVCSKGVGKN